MYSERKSIIEEGELDDFNDYVELKNSLVEPC